MWGLFYIVDVGSCPKQSKSERIKLEIVIAGPILYILGKKYQYFKR